MCTICLRYTNTKDHGAKVFELIDVTDEDATMQHRPLLDQAVQVKVALPDLKKWKMSKNHMPQLCSMEMASTILGHNHPAIQEEWTKANLTWHLHQCFEDHAVDQTKVGFGISPQELVAMQSMKKGQLKLVPVGSLAKAKPGQKGPSIAYKGTTWSIQPHKHNTSFSTDANAGSLIPAWWVKATKEADHANMVWQTMTVDSSIKIPYLTNPASVSKGDVLQYLQVEAAATTADNPAKKAKK